MRKCNRGDERRPFAKPALALILILYLALGVAYSVVNPIFESPDEALNYANIRFFIEERRLSVLEPDEPTKAHHPPLYYVLGALLIHQVPATNFDAIVERVNPFWAYQLGEAGVDNKSLYLHDPNLESFPYRDVALGVHLVRWLSLLMGAGAILCVYSTACLLFPHRWTLAIAAAALVAFNPMFLFINSSVHDDALANLVAAALLYVTAKVLMRKPTTRRAVALGLLAGLAALTKLTCLLVVPTVGLALLWRPLADRGRAGWREALYLVGIVALLMLLIGGWWFVRNQILYGEPTSMVQQVDSWGGPRENAPDLLAAIRELGFLHDSFWGAFGYGQIPMPDWVYGLVRLLGLAALGGLLLFWSRRRSRINSIRGRIHFLIEKGSEWQPATSSNRRLHNVVAQTEFGRSRCRLHAHREYPPAVLLILLSAAVVTFLVIFARMTLIDTADFGRYMFVSLSFLATLYVLGLSEWIHPGNERWLSIGLTIAMLALAIFALVGVLRPAYATPKFLSPKEVAARARPFDLRFGESIRLAGYDLERTSVRPGDEIAVTLCWESLAPMEKDYGMSSIPAYFVHFLGPEETIVGSRNTHPGLSRYPTSRWTPGDLFCDVIDVPVEHWAPAPAVYDVEVGWYKPGTNERLPAYAPDGTRVELALLDRIKVEPETHPSVKVPNRLDADLNRQITLLGYSVDKLQRDAVYPLAPGQAISITLYWTAQATVPADYTVFVHLADPDGPPYAQDDCQPRRGRYPTSFWDVGEVVTDPHTLQVPNDLPPGDYPLVAGMYLLETGERLRWLAPDGTARGDFVTLETLAIRPDEP